MCKEVGSKGVKEIVDQMLEGDDITTKHPIWPKMFGDTQLLDPTKGNDHDCAKSIDYFIIGGGGGGGGGESKRIIRPKEG